MRKVNFKLLHSYENKSKWRLNIVIRYRDTSSVKTFRQLLLTTLASVAEIRRIDFAAITDFPILEAFSDIADKEQKHYPVDVVCFRSSKHTISSSTEVREILDLLFQDYDIVLNRTAFDMYPIAQKYLKRIPFPIDKSLS